MLKNKNDREWGKVLQRSRFIYLFLLNFPVFVINLNFERVFKDLKSQQIRNEFVGFLRFRNIPKSGEQISYRTKLMNAEFVKYLANSKSVAAFFANDGSLAMALFRLPVTMEILLVLAPSTAIR